MLRNVGQNAVAGVVLGIADVVGDIIYYGVPPIYDVFSGMGRFGRGLWKVAFGFILGFVQDRVAQLANIMFAERTFVAGIMDVVKSAVNGAMGEGYAVIKRDGTVQVEDGSDARLIYKQVGGDTYRATTGSATAKWFSPVHYVIVTRTKVIYTKAPYELPVSE